MRLCSVFLPLFIKDSTLIKFAQRTPPFSSGPANCNWQLQLQEHNNTTQWDPSQHTIPRARRRIVSPVMGVDPFHVPCLHDHAFAGSCIIVGPQRTSLEAVNSSVALPAPASESFAAGVSQLLACTKTREGS